MNDPWTALRKAWRAVGGGLGRLNARLEGAAEADDAVFRAPPAPTGRPEDLARRIARAHGERDRKVRPG